MTLSSNTQVGWSPRRKGTRSTCPAHLNSPPLSALLAVDLASTSEVKKTRLQIWERFWERKWSEFGNEFRNSQKFQNFFACIRQCGGCCWPSAGRQAPASRWRAPQFCIQQTNTIYRVCSASTLVVQWYEEPFIMHKVLGSNPEIIFILPIVIY